MDISLSVFHGPNLHVPFAAVMAAFDRALQSRALPSQFQAKWLQIDERPLWPEGAPTHNLDFVELVAQIAIELQHPDDPEQARILVKREAGRASIFLGFIDDGATLKIMKSAIVVAELIFKAINGDEWPQQQLAQTLKQLRRQLGGWLPQKRIIRTLVREAQRRSIPVFPVARNSHIWLFGQGAAGTQYFEAANDQDSFTGMRLQRDKTLSNTLVKRLGFPGVNHAIAMNLGQAQTIARGIKYPVVAKPIASGKGNGVSAFVVDDDDLAEAFDKAVSVSPEGVIIEGHIPGNDHRLAVFGGKVAWVAARYPASVVGDGTSSITELIELENLRRSKDRSAIESGLLEIFVDQDMVHYLKKLGLSLDTRPPQGSRINLRSIANISKGGAIADVTDLTHPDNIEMAEAIARSFRMDTMGIDFMTQDISRSWREIECAVIEVNGTPGIFFDHRAARILDATFKANSNGRIPSVILIDPLPGYTDMAFRLLGGHGLCVGLVSETSTQLKGHSRCWKSDPLHVRIGALLADTDCAAIVIETTAQSLRTTGLPLDWADLIIAFAPLPEELGSMIRRHSSKFICPMGSEVQLDEIIDEITKRYAGHTGGG